MPRLPARLRLCAAAVTVAGAAATAVTLPSPPAAAGPNRTVRHANLLSAINGLPNYFPGVVHWKLSTSLDHYGTTDWDTNTITISAFTPLSLLYSVVAHEWSHEVQAYDYRGNLWAGVKAMDRHFGGGGKSGQRGIEYAADCMAVLQGATWTDYTSCRNDKWRGSAKRLLHGKRLKALPKKTPTTTTATDATSGSITYGPGTSDERA
ncbi:MAG TPA: hypothetical protein VHB18_12770 [Mycobacteriales bacterium]|jgi:hypothetical protein|nr:hypothetical protein [Mycobacteriales bacterium]